MVLLQSKVPSKFLDEIALGYLREARTREPLPADPWEFIRQCVFTYDERASEKKLAPVRPFPELAYCERMTREWQEHGDLLIDKSSQIMVTWWAAAVFLHLILTERGARVAWFCLRKELSEEHIRERVYRTYLLIPSRFIVPRAKIVNGELCVYHDGEAAMPTAWITPMAAEHYGHESAAQQMRSRTWRKAFVDEGAFYPNLLEIIFSLKPRCGGITEVSTANGWSGHWRLGYTQSLDAPNPMPARLEKTELMRGVYGWNNHGFRCLSVHYSADPDKDPATPAGAAWLAIEKARTPNAGRWNRERELDHSVAVNCPVYQDTQKILLRPQSYVPGYVVFRWRDFGFAGPRCIFAQVRPRKDPQPGQSATVVHVLHVCDTGNMMTQAFETNVVRPVQEEFFPKAEFRDYGDPAGSHDAGPNSALSSIEVLAGMGVIVHSKPAHLEKKFGRKQGRVDVLQDIISGEGLEIDSDDPGCVRLHYQLCGGYHRNEKGEIVKDGENDHGPDALGYGVWNVFVIAGENAGGGAVHRSPRARGPGR